MESYLEILEPGLLARISIASSRTKIDAYSLKYITSNNFAKRLLIIVILKCFWIFMGIQKRKTCFYSDPITTSRSLSIIDLASCLDFYHKLLPFLGILAAITPFPQISLLLPERLCYSNLTFPTFMRSKLQSGNIMIINTIKYSHSH